MLQKGLQRIRNEGIYKSTLIYQLLDQHHQLQPLVTTSECRSQTVMVAESGPITNPLTEHLARKGMVVSAGYGSNKHNQVRIANFPTHSKEQVEMLVDHIREFKEQA